MREKLLRVLSALLGIIAVIAAAGLIYETALIYSHKSDGAQVYTYARIRAAFGEIALPVLIFIGFAAVMLIITAVFPHRSKTKPYDDVQYEFDLMRRCTPESPEFKKEQAIQKRAAVTCAAISFICMAIQFTLVFSSDYFSTNDLETEMAEFMPAFLILTLIALASVYTAFVIRGRSRKRCHKLLKNVPCRPISASPAQGKAVLISRLVILSAALAFIALGIINGGLYDVFVKAINICTECIGLG